MVTVVLASVRQSSLAGDAFRGCRMDCFILAGSGEDAPHRLADGLGEIPLAVGAVVPAGAGARTESFVARANGKDHNGGRRSLPSDLGARRAIGRRRGPQ